MLHKAERCLDRLGFASGAIARKFVSEFPSALNVKYRNLRLLNPSAMCLTKKLAAEDGSSVLLWSNDFN